jgi:hypothetical protein
MTDDVPQELERRIWGLSSEERDLKWRYAAAASFVIQQYIGDALFRHESNPYMGIRKAPDWKGLARLTQVGSNLFELRTEPGFPEICRRLRETGRDLTSAHCETAAALQLKRQGFRIGAKPETYAKGEDFDFWASTRDCRINCEVTLLRAKEFSRNNVLNALGQKRAQLPTGLPAFINCFWPIEEWKSQAEEVKREFFSIANEFFNRTKRINYLAFSREEFVDQLGGGALLVSWQLFWHPNPRERSFVLDMMMRATPPYHRTIVKKLAAGSRRIPTPGLGRFAGWVDALLDR